MGRQRLKHQVSIVTPVALGATKKEAGLAGNGEGHEGGENLQERLLGRPDIRVIEDLSKGRKNVYERNRHPRHLWVINCLVFLMKYESRDACYSRI